MAWAVTIILGVVIFLLATVIFDLLHYTLHRLQYSQYSLLQTLGGLHQTHHDFLDRNLDIHDDHVASNIRHHVIPEFLTQFLVTSSFLLVLPAAAVYTAWAIELLVFLLILRVQGFDVNHRQVDHLYAYRPHYFCLPEYHFLHHVYPDAYFSSWVKTLDHLLKTGASLKGRRVLVALEDEKVSELFSDILLGLDAHIKMLPSGDGPSAEWLTAQWEHTDILLLGSPSNGDLVRVRNLISGFTRAEHGGIAPREIWALSIRSSDHPESERAFRNWLAFARALYKSRHVNYRHFFCDGPQSLGPAGIRRLVTGVRRGYNLVPSATGLGYLFQILQFVFLVAPDKTIKRVLSVDP